jgi:hypothetical protein
VSSVVNFGSAALEVCIEGQQRAAVWRVNVIYIYTHILGMGGQQKTSCECHRSHPLELDAQ